MTIVYHLAGVDDRERGFNRQVQVSEHGEVYRASLRYETVQISVESFDNEIDALQCLIGMLQERGYTQLRSQRLFLGEQYLGTQELWVDYPDPERLDVQTVSWLMRIRQFFGIG